MMRLALLAAVTLWAAAPAAHGQSQGVKQDGAQIVGRSARIYRSLSSLRADFVQLINNPRIDSATTRGTLVQAGDAKFAMHFSDPSGDAIVIDGAHTWIYTPSTTPGQVLKFPIPSGGPVYGYNLLAWFLDRPTERYKTTFLRTESINGRTTDVVELIPTVPDIPFDRAVLWLDRQDGLPRQLEVHEREGGTRTLTLSKLRVNERISDKTFRLDLPSSVRVVEQ